MSCCIPAIAATHHHGEVGADFGEGERVAEFIVCEGELRAPAPGISLRKLRTRQHANMTNQNALNLSVSWEDARSMALKPL